MKMANLLMDLQKKGKIKLRKEAFNKQTFEEMGRCKRKKKTTTFTWHFVMTGSR
ncbi:hypothetical protein [Caldicellulosiruptor bescii]|uniref:hypothetical protein n=2 Tax=Caldicellulosiruptor bescii TaxID=31899 RepID=UPI0015C5F07D|nr:hypothetical protein [Caldicellulosiruptor bescii]